MNYFMAIVPCGIFDVTTDCVCKDPEALVEGPHSLALGLWGQPGITRRGGISLLGLEHLDGSTNEAASLRFQNPDLDRQSTS